MAREPVDQICPEIARAEMRVCKVPILEIGVPTGEYSLREFYCTAHRPWTDWPPSDPRGGWAALTLSNQLGRSPVWLCAELAASASLRDRPQCVQLARTNDPASLVGYWLWRFDRVEDPVPLDNFWLKTPQQALQDLREANNPTVGRPESLSDVEFTVDPYFPKTAPTVAAELKGIAVHRGGRNRLMLDQRAEFIRDARLR